MKEESHSAQHTFFAPHLALSNVADGMEFYTKAFDAVELRRWSNPDGSVHVAEMAIGGAMFHLHEEVLRNNEISPARAGGTTVVIGLFVEDTDTVVAKALAAGGIEKSPLQSYDYGYRQATIVDPFGHYWLIEKKI